ncbi:MAG: hypothetical protein IIC90_04505 [Chloroflexi bacterium]|nr:hypothetical protein [Chloroflexota bacterium]
MARTSRWRAAALFAALLSISLAASVSWTVESEPMPEPDHAFLQEQRKLL